MKKLQTSILSLGLVLLACSKAKDAGDGNSSDPEASTGGQKYSTPGVHGERADISAVSVAGTLALSLDLTAGTPNRVLAFRSSNGRFDNVAEAIAADVEADGKFAINLPQEGNRAEEMEAAKLPDGSFDRDKLAEILGEPVPGTATDDDIQEHIEEVKSAGGSSGPAYTLVAMKDGEDPQAEAASFQFIGMESGGTLVNGLPINAAKGDLSLGTISGRGDQGTAELELSEEVFALPLETMQGMSAASKALKIIKNAWMNQNEEGASYEVTPFYLWHANLTAAKAGFTAPESAAFSGMGMYLGVRNAGLTFEDICTPSGKSITLVPPAEIDVGQLGKINASRPFSNGGLTAIAQESTRRNCGGTDTGFYGAGNPGEQDLMMNWGTGGNITSMVEGLWDFQVDGVSKAKFELASSSPLDAGGKPLVFIPSVKVSMANGAVGKIEVELYRYDSESNGFVKIEDLSAFRSIVSGFQAELSSSSSNQGKVDERVSLLDKINGAVMSVSAEDFEAKYADNGSLSVAVYYEMFGGSYRLEVRP